MKVEMRYGTGTLPIEIPDKNIAGVLEISESVPLSDEDGAVRAAIAQPIASPPLVELAKGRESACIVISDVTRPVPNKVILPPLLETLKRSGIPRERDYAPYRYRYPPSQCRERTRTDGWTRYHGYIPYRQPFFAETRDTHIFR